MAEPEGKDDLRWQRGVDLPPPPVLAVTGIVLFFLYLTWQMHDYEEQLHRRTKAGLWVFLVLGLVFLAVLARHALVAGDGRVAVPVSWRDQLGSEDGASPWAVAAVVVLLLVLASHLPSFQMFRLPWQYN